MTGNDVTYIYSTSGRTEDGAAQSERRANSFVFPSQSNVGVANPMHAAVDCSHYAYDYAGERTIKLTGRNSVLDVNADLMRTASVLSEITIYPSPYVVLSNYATYDDPETDVYYYHSDHLGSASWITDNGGQAILHLQYLPYGEPYINQRTSGYSERFTFTGKERDTDTGYGYFDARYMDHELMTMWLSVDPMADKYPNISPYAYCAWNPLKFVDQDGLTPRIYIETKGVGHAFVSVESNGKTIVYTYGRYVGGDKNKSFARSSDPTGKGVLIRLTGEEAQKYINHEIEDKNASVYEFGDASDETVMQYYETLFALGVELNTQDAEIYDRAPNRFGSSKDARVIDHYSIFDNNCVTTSIKGIIRGGSKIKFTKTIYCYPDILESPIFTPKDLKTYLDRLSRYSDIVKRIEIPDVDIIIGAY